MIKTLLRVSKDKIKSKCKNGTAIIMNKSSVGDFNHYEWESDNRDVIISDIRLLISNVDNWKVEYATVADGEKYVGVLSSISAMQKSDDYVVINANEKLADHPEKVSEDKFLVVFQVIKNSCWFAILA